MANAQATRLYNEAGELHKRAKDIINEFDGKVMPQDKANEVETLLDQVEEKTNQARNLERADEQEKLFNTPVNALGASGATGEQPDTQTIASKAFNRALKHGVKALNPTELKALRADDDDAGGFLVAPQQFAAGLLKFVDDQVYIRKLADVQQITTSESLGIVTLDSDFGDPTWTTELATGNEDTSEPFGKRELRPHPLARRIKLSNTLIRKSTINVEQLVQQRMAYRLGVVQENAYLTGDGAAKPLGMFTASAAGIPTSRDVTAAAVNEFTADELIDTKFSLKAQYQMSTKTRWIMHRDAIKMARKLKDGNGQYIWAPGLQGQPDRILDIPYAMSEFAPNTFTTGQYIALLGDLSFYTIVDSLAMQVQVLLELYAETNQRGYIVRYEGDGAPVLAEAFARLKFA